MRRHARPEIEGDAIEVVALSRRTLSPALLETGEVRIAVVPTPRTLREIAAERGQLPDLRGCETARRGCEFRIGLSDVRVRRDRGDRRRGADPEQPRSGLWQSRSSRRSERYRQAARGRRRASGAREIGAEVGDRCDPRSALFAGSAPSRRPLFDEVQQPVGSEWDWGAGTPIALPWAFETAGSCRHGRLDLADAECL